MLDQKNTFNNSTSGIYNNELHVESRWLKTTDIKDKEVE